MIHYTILFQLQPDKENEFSLSWDSFYSNMKEIDGLNACTIMDVGQNQHKIEMIWNDQYYLNLFMKGEWHTFLHGAISVLGNKSEIIQKFIES